MEIKHIHKNLLGAFVVDQEGVRQAELVYRLDAPKMMTIVHTEVNKDLQGKNIGFKLVEAAVTYARENAIKVVPECEFAQSIFNRTQSFQDVLALS
jgi:predicted GNAT family acetyltransferase